MGGMWDKSKGLQLMKEYVDKRRRALNKRDEEKIRLVIERIQALALKNNVQLDRLDTKDKRGWEVVYGTISDGLQSAKLNINFEARNWFSAENTREGYISTYDPAKRNLVDAGGKTALKTQYRADGTESEMAKERLGADQKVTIPESWKDASRLHPQRRRLYKAMTTGSKNKKSGGFSMHDYTEIDIDDRTKAALIDNRRFNPYTKQIFAALNACKRPHGANIFYGYSYLELKSELKQKAIYFPMDTFNVAQEDNAVDRQCTFETIGALLAYCDDSLADELWQACYIGNPCADSAGMKRMIEAHIFQDIKMAQHVEAIHLCRTTENGAIPEDEWSVILANAYQWAKLNSVRVYLNRS